MTNYTRDEEQELLERIQAVRKKLKNVPLSAFVVSDLEILLKFTGLDRHYFIPKEKDCDLVERRIENWEKYRNNTPLGS